MIVFLEKHWLVAAVPYTTITGNYQHSLHKINHLLINKYTSLEEKTLHSSHNIHAALRASYIMQFWCWNSHSIHHASYILRQTNCKWTAQKLETHCFYLRMQQWTADRCCSHSSLRETRSHIMCTFSPQNVQLKVLLALNWSLTEPSCSCPESVLRARGGRAGEIDSDGRTKSALCRPGASVSRYLGFDLLEFSHMRFWNEPMEISRCCSCERQSIVLLVFALISFKRACSQLLHREHIMSRNWFQPCLCRCERFKKNLHWFWLNVWQSKHHHNAFAWWIAIGLVFFVYI